MTPRRRRYKLMRWLNKRGYITGLEICMWRLSHRRLGNLWTYHPNEDVMVRDDYLKRQQDENT